MTELTGLPAAGPTSLEAVKVALTVKDGADDARLTPYVDAANALVRSWPVSQAAVDSSWPAYIVSGATMLAARWWRRKGTPAGVEAVGEAGFAYVMRNDPDIAMMLKLGNYAGPGVG